MSQIQVTKRNGMLEPLDLSKFHRVTAWACENLNGVSESLIELKSHVQFYDKIRTADIQETLIKASSELISEDTPNYQYVASRLINYALRKEVYNQPVPCGLYLHIKSVVDAGYYDQEILEQYTETEINWLDKQLEHSRDFVIAYAGMEQFRGKYLVKNRATKKFYETPQMTFMLIAMTLFAKYGKETRLKWVKDFYDAVSTFEISLPTPIMAGLRTPQRQFSSCVLIESGDSLDSIIATAGSIIKYVSQKAGIGIGAGSIRAVGSPVRNGDATSEGNIPYYKLFQSATKSCSQGGVRGGSATIHTVFWHLEIEDLLVLKNNKGTDETRVRNLDYSIQFNKVMYERLLSGGNITLFSPHDVPDLYDAFFIDIDRFRELYVKYEANSKIRKKIVPAIDLFSIFLQERKDTGRIYLQNVDHANDHGAFRKDIAPIKQSNLCLIGDTIVTVQLSNGDLKDMQLHEVIESEEEYRVLSRNVKTGKDEFKRILARAQTGSNRKVMKITDDCGNSVICTPEHKIYTKNRGYIEAKNLLSTDVLQIKTRKSEKDTMLKIEYLEDTFDVFDLTVEDNHNFYADGILVHNCQEITLPVKPLKHLHDEEGEISLCTLAAVNWGKIKHPSDFERLCTLIVRGLDELLDYQNYPVRAAELSTMNRRPLGIGIVNLAYWLAKNDLSYQNITPAGLQKIHVYAEAWSYYLIKASVDLAIEKGACPKYLETKYGSGIMPIDTYKKEVDELVEPIYNMDWATLKTNAVTYGIRNSTLMALMPAETSAQVSNSTNGIEPPRALVSIKTSKDGVLKQVVPEVRRLKNKYDLLWDQKSPEGYLKICAVLQKFIDQGISVNTSYNPKFYEGEEISLTELIKHIIMFYKYGGKQLYYFNTFDGAGEVHVESMETLEDEDCESCKI